MTHILLKNSGIEHQWCDGNNFFCRKLKAKIKKTLKIPKAKMEIQKSPKMQKKIYISAARITQQNFSPSNQHVSE